MLSETKKTPLYDWHAAQGANMADFGGYTMPLWYPSGTRAEHLAVLKAAGLFDTSHMAMIRVWGKDARSFLQDLFTKNLEQCLGPKNLPLIPGRAVYGAFLNEKGHALDDALVYMVKEGLYLVAVNAGMGGALAAHLASFAEKKEVQIEDLTDRLGKIDIQGPFSGKILLSVLEKGEKLFSSMPYFSFKDGLFGENSEIPCRLKDGTPILLSRTGYTGELGFEIFCQSDATLKVWEMILHAGKDFSLIPCGLAARDSLRGGAFLPLSHQDIGAWPFVNNPWMFALPFNEEKTAFTKPFLGDEALLQAMKTTEYTYAFLGKDLRKVAAGPDTAVLLDDKKIGSVLTCVTDMGMGLKDGRLYSVASPDLPEGAKIQGLSCGFVLVKGPLPAGCELVLDDGKRKLPVTLTDSLRPDRTARKAISSMLV